LQPLAVHTQHKLLELQKTCKLLTVYKHCRPMYIETM